MAKRKSLPELRKRIDDVDRKILDLVAKRARIAHEVGEAKNRGTHVVLDVAREKAVIDRLRKANPGPLGGDAIEAIFREIISACRATQEPTTVAFLGPGGTFSNAAAVKQFGETAIYEPVDTIADVFSAAESGRARYGVVPIENTTEGAVTPTLDALADTPLRVVAEVLVKIDHHLLARSVDPRKVKRILSHPQPLAQCRNFLAHHFPGIPLEPCASTAAAAQQAKKTPGTAAVAGALAGRLYGLKTVEASIADNASNVTRFLVVGNVDPDAPFKASGDDRTSLVISVRDEVGVLGRILQPFTANKVNLSMIESRPIVGRSWEYRFFVDVCGHVNDANLAKALRAVDRISISTKVLGSYPIAR
jgi:chorismate mutase/prephenate dehydratase